MAPRTPGKNGLSGGLPGKFPTGLASASPPDGLSDDHWGELVSDLPGLKSAGGTEEILRNMVGERVLGLPPEPRLDKGIPFSELRAKEKEGAVA